MAPRRVDVAVHPTGAALVQAEPKLRARAAWRRSCWGGRALLRTVRYTAALTATRRNAHIHAFDQRLIAAGKPVRVALVACLRKLLVICNALCRTQTTWDPTMP